ncbi:MAG: hypothetical protein WDN47_03355 [Candidatus Doudnabacteria bacterium]
MIVEILQGILNIIKSAFIVLIVKTKTIPVKPPDDHNNLSDHKH